jgi:hypothetical protein
MYAYIQDLRSLQSPKLNLQHHALLPVPMEVTGLSNHFERIPFLNQLKISIESANLLFWSGESWLRWSLKICLYFQEDLIYAEYGISDSLSRPFKYITNYWNSRIAQGILILKSISDIHIYFKYETANQNRTAKVNSKTNVSKVHKNPGTCSSCHISLILHRFSEQSIIINVC